MASAPMEMLVPVSTSTVNAGVVNPSIAAIVIVHPRSAKLVEAVKVFLKDLETAFSSGSNSPSDEALANLRGDLKNLLVLAGAEESRVANRLNSDLAAFIDAGQITPVARMRLIDDLESLLLTVGVPGQVVPSAANEAIAPQGQTIDHALEQILADPNRLGSARAGETRGQDMSPRATTPPILGSTGSVLPEAESRGLPFRTLLDNLKGILGKSRFVSPDQAKAVRNNFAAIAIQAKRPDVRLTAILRSDLDAVAGDGRLTNSGLVKLANDLSAVLKSAGIPPRLVDRAIQDLAPAIQAPDISVIDLRTMIKDLTDVLAARPSRLLRGGSWWFGGRPTGL